MPTLCPDELLQESAERIQQTYVVESARMQRAVELVRRGSVRKMLKPEAAWRVSSSTYDHAYWQVNDEQLTCDCPDWQKHNLPIHDQSTFICKHLAAVFLTLKIEAEMLRQPAPDIAAIMNALFGQPLKAAKAAK